MSGFGVGYGDIVTAIRQGKQLYDSFHDEFENSPKQLQELLEISKDVRDTVLRYEEVVSRWGQRLPGIESIRSKLAEADKIVERNSEVIERPGVAANGARYRARRVWKIARLGFDERITKITDGLQLQLGMLVAKFFAIAAQNSQNQIPGDTYGLHGSVIPQDHRALTDLSRDLIRIRYERQRIAGRAQMRGIEANYESSNQDIVELFEQLCRSAGLSERDHIPPLLLDQTGPGIVPHNFLQDTFANQEAIHNRNYRPGSYAVPRRPVRSTTVESSRVLTVPNTPTPQHASPYPTGSDASTPMTQTTTYASTIQGSINTPSTMITTPIYPMPEAPGLGPTEHVSSPPLLGEPAIPMHRATFVPANAAKRMKLELDTWKFVSPPGRRGRILEWTGHDPAYTLKHELPKLVHETFPYTKHSALKEKPLSLSFQSLHHITIKKNDKPVMNNKGCNVEYRFTDAEYLRVFQSDLRDKDLLGTYETAKIKCKNGNHINEHVKIWRSRDIDQAPSLSFYASGSDEGFVEYALKWFKSPTLHHGAKREITLELTKPSPGEGKRKGIFRRKSNTIESPVDSPRSSYFPEGPTSPSLAHRNSTVTMSSTNSANNEDFPACCSLETYDKVRQLHMTFSSEKDDSNYEDFLKAYRDAQKPSSTMPRPSSGSSAITTSTHSRASSIIEPIAELSDPHLVGSPASTHDDIYRVPRLTAQGTPVAELPVKPSDRLFPIRRPTGSVQHAAGYQHIYSDQPRLSPPSPSTVTPLTERKQQANAPTSAGYTELGIHIPRRATLGLPAPRVGSVELRSDRDPHELHETTSTQRTELDGDSHASSDSEMFEMDTQQPAVKEDVMEDTVILDATGGLGGSAPLSLGAPRRSTGLLENGSSSGHAVHSQQRYLPYRPP